jgi:ribonuclease P protein subunit POP4
MDASQPQDVLYSCFTTENHQDLKAAEKFILDSLDPEIEYEHLWNSKLREKSFPLDNTANNQIFPQKQPKAHRISNRQKKKSGLYKPDSQIRFEDVAFLNESWQAYMQQLTTGNSSSLSSPVFLEKLLKADFHGCILSVEASRNPLLVGIKGIVLEECANSFLLLPSNSPCKRIPKEGCIFSFSFEGRDFRIWGKQFSNNDSASRTGKKFKRKTIKMLF